MLTNIFKNMFAGMGINRGDRVNMFVATQKVASGSVCEIDPNAYCSGVLIGEGNVSVSIDLCFQKNIPLPFPTMDALRVSDAFHSIVRWSIGSLQHMHVMQQEGISMHEENIASESLEAHFDGLSYREVWKDRRVKLWDESKTQVVAEGIIMYVNPFDLINFDVLGDDNIGIGIETSFDSEFSMSVDDICSVNLISWPIKRVTTMDGKSLLQYEELLRTNEIRDMHIEPAFLVQPLSKKRKYCFTNRKPKMSINPSKKSKQISLPSVQLVSSIDCCAKRCCQYAERDMVLDLRKEFWGQTLQKRTNYVYDTLLTSWRQNTIDTKKDYVFSFNGREICCRGWYEIHGISKTSFYRYREQFENGVRRSVHGNEGVIRKV